MTAQPPVTSYETVHDYRLLEEFQRKEATPVLVQQSWSRATHLLPVILAALALVLALAAFVYAYLNRPVPLVPGSFQNATVVVGERGRIVSVTQGASPTTITVAPLGIQPGQTSSSSPEAPRFPWSPRTRNGGQAGSGSSESPGDATKADSSDAGVPAKVVEDFVKFQSVRFKTGMVETGWRYVDSDATVPAHQWCYYKAPVGNRKGFIPMLDLEQTADPDAISAMGLTQDEYAEAQGKCQWFNGLKPIGERPQGKTY